MSTHSHRTLAKQIDALDGAETVADLVAALKPILHTLAYYATMSDGAVLETHEEWHGNTADTLYADATETFQAAQAKRAAKGLPLEPTPANGPRPAPPPRLAKDGSVKVHRVPHEPKNRPAPSHISPALRAILDGSHSSLHEEG